MIRFLEHKKKFCCAVVTFLSYCSLCDSYEVENLVVASFQLDYGGYLTLKLEKSEYAKSLDIDYFDIDGCSIVEVVKSSSQENVSKDIFFAECSIDEPPFDLGKLRLEDTVTIGLGESQINHDGVYKVTVWSNFLEGKMILSKSHVYGREVSKSGTNE